MSAIAAVQNAIYVTLAADATLVAMLAPNIKTGGPGIVNDVLDGQEYPHVLMSNSRERGEHTFGGPNVGLGWNVAVSLYSRSRKDGDLQALQIHGRIVALLNFQPLTVTGWPNVSVEYAPGGDMTGQVMVLDVKKVQVHQVLAEFDVKVRQ